MHIYVYVYIHIKYITVAQQQLTIVSIDVVFNSGPVDLSEAKLFNDIVKTSQSLTKLPNQRRVMLTD